MTEVIPSIIPESFEDLASHVSRVRKLVSRVQIDIANGSYAPSHTWPYTSSEHFKEVIAQEEGLPFWEEVDYEVDMLIAKPEHAIEDWVSAGVSGVIVHIETLSAGHSDILKNVRMSDAGVGLALKPSTPIEALAPYIEYADFIQCMGNDNIGYHGVSLDDRVYEKIRAIRKQYPKLSIAVDIGVDETTAPLLVEAGVTKLVSGSAIFDSTDPAAAVEFFSGLEAKK